MRAEAQQDGYILKKPDCGDRKREPGWGVHLRHGVASPQVISRRRGGLSPAPERRSCRMHAVDRVERHPGTVS